MVNYNQSNTNEEPLTLPQEIINRLEKRKRECWQNQSPYISPKEEWLEIVIKVNELKKMIK